MAEALLRERLHAGLALLPFAVSDTQAEKMLAYLALLNRWNAVHNLTAVRDPLSQVSVHILDSLALLPFVGEECRTLADVGSGAGLPALMMAIMRPQMQVYAVEASRKKCAFIRQAAIALQLERVTVVNQRVENWQPQAAMDVIISRAMASLPLFLRFLIAFPILYALKSQTRAVHAILLLFSLYSSKSLVSSIVGDVNIVA